MSEKLPEFTYHPDPLGSGSIEASETICACCERARGYIYTGPIYAQDSLENRICPWCIADGSAHQKFGASFTDEAGIGGYGAWDAVPDDVIAVVAYHTPGIIAWQQEKWWTHCADAGIFLGLVGYAELTASGEQAVAAIANESGLEGDDLDTYMRALKKNGAPCAYLFQCRHCGAYGGYSDSD